MIRYSHLTALAACLILLIAMPLAAQQKMFGYSQESAEIQSKIEEFMASSVQGSDYGERARKLAGHINMAGTPGSRENAEYLRDFYSSLGMESHIYSFFVYLPHPVENYVIVHGEDSFVLKPGEAGIAEDEYSRSSLTPFNAFSANDTVRSELVYVNYGLPADFEVLTEKGVELEGKIALCRYGRTFRGSKVAEAEKHGMVGMILYSDPQDDGYVKGDPYPVGRMRPADALQRGSILNMVASPGDPLTPLVPATKDAQRLDPADAQLPGIPCMPLGSAHAEELFKRIAGEDVPQAWQGGLPLRYHIGPGPLEVTLHVKADYQVREIWDTIAVLPGAQETDSWVMVGCHRDSWLYGAQDPHSGTVTLMEAARVLVEATKEFGPFKRSLVFCSWDAEEFGIIGSIEWVEQFREELSEKAVVYMNADGMISGKRFWAAASPTLKKVYGEVIRQVKGPDDELLFDAWAARRKENDMEVGEFPFGSFGGGSDHTGFLHHVGVPCMAAGFSDRSGIYHSSYDTVTFMEKLGDPDYLSHQAGSRLISILLGRIANADILPMDIAAYADEFTSLLDDFEKEHGKIDHDYRSAYNGSVEKLQRITKNYNTLLETALDRGMLTTQKRLSINNQLRKLERSFIDEQGLPGQKWYRNLLYAVSRENGYGKVFLPGLQATIKEQADFSKEFNRVIYSMKRYTQTANNIVKMLSN